MRAISQALAKANMTLEAIVLLAKQYDAKYELSEKLVTLIAPHQERVGAAISDASSYATGDSVPPLSSTHHCLPPPKVPHPITENISQLYCS